MKLESVDYVNTFIAIASGASGEVPAPHPRGGKPAIASATFEMIRENPYRYTSGDVIFTVRAGRRGIPDDDRAAARAAFYSTGRPCLRASDLGKRYGWGVHAGARGRLALYPAASPEYAALEAGAAPDGTPVTGRPRDARLAHVSA